MIIGERVLLLGKNLTGVKMKARRQRILSNLVLLKSFHCGSYLKPGLQDASHTFDGRLSQLVRFATIIVNAPLK